MFFKSVGSVSHIHLGKLPQRPFGNWKLIGQMLCLSRLKQTKQIFFLLPVASWVKVATVWGFLSVERTTPGTSHFVVNHNMPQCVTKVLPKLFCTSKAERPWKAFSVIIRSLFHKLGPLATSLGLELLSLFLLCLLLGPIKGSGQQLLLGFVTTKRELIGFRILRWTQDAFRWSWARLMCDISEWKFLSALQVYIFLDSLSTTLKLVKLIYLKKDVLNICKGCKEFDHFCFGTNTKSKKII